MTVQELTERLAPTMSEELYEEFVEDIAEYTGQRPGVNYQESESLPNGVVTYWLNRFEDSRSIIRVERPRDWWRSNYTVCLSEAIRALGRQDQIDMTHVLQLLPVLSEAAQMPELEALEAEMRLAAGEQVHEQERQDARQAVTWIGGPIPSRMVG